MFRWELRRARLVAGAGLVVALLLGALPAQAAAAGRVVRDIAYAEAEPAGSVGHLLDLYLPRHGRRAAPLVIWTHGSGWLAENGRDGAGVVAAHFNPRGFAVAGVAIRSSADARFPGQLDDIRAAVRYLRAHAGRYHLDPRRIGIMGESSGGWTAAMAAVTGEVRAAVAFYPPTDFLRMDAHMLAGCVPFNQAFGLDDCHADPLSPESRLLGCPIESCPRAVARANPVTYVGRTDPPLLILHGQRDVFVPWQQGDLLFRAAAKACGDATEVLLPDGAHGQWNEFLTDPAVNAGAREQRARGCRPGRARPVRLSWDYVVDFFERSR